MGWDLCTNVEFCFYNELVYYKKFCNKQFKHEQMSFFFTFIWGKHPKT